MILVSHDRYFVSKTANKIWEIVDHEIKEFKGGYEEWVKWKERMAMQKKEKEGEKKSEVTPKKVEAPIPVQKPVHTAIDKEAKKELQKVQKQFQQLEEKIAQLNKKKTELESSPVSYTHLRAHETVLDLVCRLLLEKKNIKTSTYNILTSPQK